MNIYFSNQNHWLISPDFDLSGGSYELTMDVAVTEWNLTTSSNMGSDDNVKLLVSETQVLHGPFYILGTLQIPQVTRELLYHR